MTFISIRLFRYFLKFFRQENFHVLWFPLYKRVIGFLPEAPISACFMVLGGSLEVFTCFIVTDFESMMFELFINFGC